MFVDPPKPLGYNFSVAASAVTRRGNRLNCKARSALNRRFFYGRFFPIGGWRGAAFGLAGVLADRFFHSPRSSAALVVENEAADSLSARSLS